VTWCNRFQEFKWCCDDGSGSKEKQEYKNQKVILVFKELQDLMVRQVLQNMSIDALTGAKGDAGTTVSQRDSKCS
jgi:hypothetical protein